MKSAKCQEKKGTITEKFILFFFFYDFDVWFLRITKMKSIYFPFSFANHPINFMSKMEREKYRKTVSWCVAMRTIRLNLQFTVESKSVESESLFLTENPNMLFCHNSSVFSENAEFCNFDDRLAINYAQMLNKLRAFE